MRLKVIVNESHLKILVAKRFMSTIYVCGNKRSVQLKHVHWSLIIPSCQTWTLKILFAGRSKTCWVEGKITHRCLWKFWRYRWLKTAYTAGYYLFYCGIWLLTNQTAQIAVPRVFQWYCYTLHSKVCAVSWRMKQALKIVEDWYRRVNLSVILENTALIQFTKRRKCFLLFFRRLFQEMTQLFFSIFFLKLL